MELSENVERIRKQMAEAAARAGRSLSDIQLCAASKTQDIETVRAAAELNIDIFGENRVQELVEKSDVGAYGGKPLHFIGHLQTNKVKQVVGRASIIQSVDSVHLMETVNTEAGKKRLVQEILLEVNIGGEESKSGVAPDGLEKLMEYSEDMQHLRVLGLMSIPPVMTDDSENRRYFAEMYELFERMKSKKYSKAEMKYLSMGMSADFCNAILEGANIVRVGTAIFGARNYK